MKNIALVQLAYDGITTYHCGVGAVIRNSLVAIELINKELRGDVNIKSYLLTPDYSGSSPNYSHNLLMANTDFCQSTGGGVRLLPLSDRDGIQFGNIHQWTELCHGGKRACLDIANNNLVTLIIAHDTAFAQLPLSLSRTVNQASSLLRLLWVPHCTTLIYDGEGAHPLRFQWESEAFGSANGGGYKIGYLGQFMRQHFQEKFGVEEAYLAPYEGGINPERLSPHLCREEIIAKLKQRGIPTDKGLVFTIGRGNPIKGHDLVLDLFHHLSQIVPGLHLVVLAPKTEEAPRYVGELETKKRRLNLDATMIYEFDPELPAYLYQWENTVLVPLLSRMDSHPLTVMEARANSTHSIVLASNRGGLPEQIDEGIDGFICDIDSIDSMIQKALQIVNMDGRRRTEIIENGKKKIRERYDFKKNLLSTLQHIFPELTTVD